MNKVIIIGGVTKEPEYAQTSSGVSVVKMDVAVNRIKAVDGQPNADFFKVVVWRGLADKVKKYVHKGSKVGVVGTLQNRSYEDKDGNKRYVTEIVADEVEFLSSTKEKTEELKEVKEDLPF